MFYQINVLSDYKLIKTMKTVTGEHIIQEISPELIRELKQMR